MRKQKSMSFECDPHPLLLKELIDVMEDRAVTRRFKSPKGMLRIDQSPVMVAPKDDVAPIVFRYIVIAQRVSCRRSAATEMTKIAKLDDGDLGPRSTPTLTTAIAAINSVV